MNDAWKTDGPDLDPASFPLTTQAGLLAHEQEMLDALNYDSLMEAQDLGPLTESQVCILAELEEKRRLRTTWYECRRLTRSRGAATVSQG